MAENSLQAYIPESILYRKGIIRNIDPELSNDEIKNVIFSNTPIKDIRRITKKQLINNTLKIINSQTIVISFRGQNLPETISIYGARCYVQSYIYKITQCENCLHFGHVSRQCRTKIRCKNCGDKHDTSSCTYIPPNNTPFCINCQGNHTATDKNCPKY